MKKKIVLAGGCFWSLQKALNDEDGVLITIVGYAGGDKPYPTYQEVCDSFTHHAECVQVIYETTKISLKELLYLFFKLHNPTTINQQGSDKGEQYRSIIFVNNQGEEKIAKEVIDDLNRQKRYQKPIVTQVQLMMPFYPAESYHQNYLIKQGIKNTCYLDKPAHEWKAVLTKDEYKVLREKKTEIPYIGQYDDFFEKGVYRCKGCGLKLFESDMKFKSKSGWPAFNNAIQGHVKIKRDFSLFMIRDEALCARCCSHLGHVFLDDSSPTGERFCINSIAIDFEKKR